MEQQGDVVQSTFGIAAGTALLLRGQAPRPAPRGTLVGTVLTIVALLLSYVGVVRLLF